MAITTPCIIIFNDFDPSSLVVQSMPFIDESTMSFKIINNTNLTSGWDATTTCSSLFMGSGQIQYDGVDVYTGAGSEYTQYWDNPLGRAIYVTNWGSISSSDQDNIYSWLTETGAGTILQGDDLTLANRYLRFNDLIIPYRTNGEIDFNSNGNSYDYMNWTSNNDYTVRYFLGSNYIEPYTGDTWVNTSYKDIIIGDTGSHLTKTTFIMWILLNTTPKSLPTYKLGWRYTPQS